MHDGDPAPSHPISVSVISEACHRGNQQASNVAGLVHNTSDT